VVPLWGLVAFLLERAFGSELIHKCYHDLELSGYVSLYSYNVLAETARVPRECRPDTARAESRFLLDAMCSGFIKEVSPWLMGRLPFSVDGCTE
jgi:hypothetical protein